MKLAPLAILVIFIGLLMVPVNAGTKYMSGGPEMTASISGTNEFTPGDDATIRIFIENRGLIDIKFVQSGIVERDDLPNTAKLVRATLQQGTAPLTIKSDSQMVGDIRGGDRILVPFSAKIDSGAAAGTYLLPLTLQYTYLREAEQYGQDSITYTYKEVNETIDLPVTIKPEAFLTIEDLSTEHLNAGNEGYLTMRIHNSGFVDASSAVLKIARNGNSPVIPTETSVYIGEFPANDTVETRFKVSVSREAGEQKYPLDVFLIYKDNSGDTITSDILTIGIPVRGKIEFMVTGTPESLRVGEKGVIEVEYQNTGAATAYSAQARISAVDPFTSNDDTAFLGDLQPGQTAVARYEVSVDESATPKEYGLDSEIRYRDALGNSQISDTMKVKITIGESSILFPAVAGILLLLVVSGAAYYFIKRKKKS
jgi:LPXTG-motif cell wall-anchored protein